MDQKNYLRVISYSQEHPLLLPARHAVRRLLFLQFHLQLLHAGTQSILASIREKYWPLNAKSWVKKAIPNCTICCRFKKETAEQIMGDLPRVRVQPTLPFRNTGVDYVEPVLVRHTKKQKKYFF